MTHDPIVGEVRKIRHDIEEECEKRGESYFDYILKEQKKNQARLVSPASSGKKHSTDKKASTG